MTIKTKVYSKISTDRVFTITYIFLAEHVDKPLLGPRIIPRYIKRSFQWQMAFVQQ